MSVHGGGSGCSGGEGAVTVGGEGIVLGLEVVENTTHESPQFRQQVHHSI
jgi:hypothetical protein